MTELMFECYSIPKLLYGVDSFFSWHHNEKSKESSSETALIISLGFNTVHIVALVDGKIIEDGLRLICCSWGQYNI